jgi:hypothetical protein
VTQPTGANTLVVTDASGNTATYTVTVSVPTVTLIPVSGAAGASVEVTGAGYLAITSTYVVTFDGTVMTTSPTPLTSATGSIIAFFTVPTTAAVGTHTVTLTDSSGNIGSATFTVTSAPPPTIFTVSTSELSSSAATLNSAGAAQTSFAPGATVKFSFGLQTISGSGSVVWAITITQGTTVYNIVNVPASISTSVSTETFSQLIPAGAAAGTWTATIQVYASNGVTPLAVTTLSFTVT